MPATITTKHWRGTYVARIELDKHRNIQREWVDDPKIERLKTGGSVRRYTITEPGWYETREGYRTHKGVETPKKYWRVDRTTVEEVTQDHALRALDGPLPGENGEWFGPTCECGNPVDGYDEEGWPYCNTHDPERFNLPQWSKNGSPVPA